MLEDDADTNNTAVVIVNWTKGSEIHFGLFLKDALEGVIGKLSDTTDVATPIVSKIITDITSLGRLLPPYSSNKDKDVKTIFSSLLSNSVLDLEPLERPE